MGTGSHISLHVMLAALASYPSMFFIVTKYQFSLSCLVNLNSSLFSGNFGGCSCTAQNEVSRGACPSKCGTLVPFMVVLFISTLLVGATQMPLLIVVLRSVREEEKAFALGLQFVFFRLFGYIPRLFIFLSIALFFLLFPVQSFSAIWSTPPAYCGKRLAVALMVAASSLTSTCSASSISALALLSRWGCLRKGHC